MSDWVGTMGRTILVIAAFAVIYFLAASGERRLAGREPKPRAAPVAEQDSSEVPVAVPVPPPASPATLPAPAEPDPETAEPDFGPERPEGRWLSTGPTALRAGPSILYPEIGLLLEGSMVEVTGRQDDWLRIRAPGGVAAFVPAGLFHRVDGDARRP